MPSAPSKKWNIFVFLSRKPLIFGPRPEQSLEGVGKHGKQQIKANYVVIIIMIFIIIVIITIQLL